MPLISLAAAAASLGLALNFEGVKSAITSARKGIIKPAAGRPSRRQIVAHYLPGPKSDAVSEPVARNDAALPISMQDREYWSYIAGLGTSLPLITLAGTATLPLAIGTGLVWFGFLPLLRNAWDQLTVRRMVGMEVTNVIFFVWLMSTGLTAYAAFGLTTFYVSRAVLIHTRKNARQKLTPLMDVEARLKHTRLHGTNLYVPFGKLKKGDVIDVAAGDLIPVDGIVTAGSATIDEHQLTGEPVGREKEVGDTVYAMTMVNAGALVVTVERGWHESSAARLMHILSRTTDARPAMQIKADAYADRAAPIALLAGLATIPFGGPMMGMALYNSLPGKQFRLVSPFAMLTTLRQAAQKGVLVKDGRVFESIDSIKVIAFDKTGTLTDTALDVGDIIAVAGTEPATALALAAGVQGQLEHPIALALCAAAKTRGIDLPVFDQIAQDIGLGVRGLRGGSLVQLGSQRFMTKAGIALPAEIRAAADGFEATGASAIVLACNGEAVATIELRPTLRAGARDVVARLQHWGFHVAIISGDAEIPTRWVGEQLGVDSWHAGMLPHDKAALIDGWQEAGRGVCYVGDGMNDGAALRGAALSISMKGAASLAVDEAQVILMRPDLNGVVDFFEAAYGFSRRARTALGASSAVELLGTVAVVFSGATVLTTLALNHLAIWAGLGVFHAAPGSSKTEPRRAIGSPPQRALPRPDRPVAPSDLRPTPAIPSRQTTGPVSQMSGSVAAEAEREKTAVGLVENPAPDPLSRSVAKPIRSRKSPSAMPAQTPTSTMPSAQAGSSRKSVSAAGADLPVAETNSTGPSA